MCEGERLTRRLVLHGLVSPTTSCCLPRSHTLPHNCDRGTESKRQRERETETERQRETGSSRWREPETETERQRQKEAE